MPRRKGVPVASPMAWASIAEDAKREMRGVEFFDRERALKDIADRSGMHVQTLRRLLFAYDFLGSLPEDMAELRQALRHQQQAGVYVLRQIFRADPEQGIVLAHRYVDGLETPATLAEKERSMRAGKSLNSDPEVRLSQTAFCQRLRRRIITEIQRQQGESIEVVWAALRWRQTGDRDDEDAELDHVKLAMQNPATKLIYRQSGKRGLVIVHAPTAPSKTAAKEQAKQSELSIDVGWSSSLSTFKYDVYHIVFSEHDRLRVDDEIARWTASRSKVLLM